MAEVKPNIEGLANIKVIGVGGSGGSAINRMIQARIRGVEFLAINTDLQALNSNNASTKLHIGKEATRGLGAGMDPEIGRRSAEESANEIREALRGADMVFITCGLGGGTGTGAAPLVAAIARDLGALTIAVVTKPFAFEGAQRKAIGERGFQELRSKVDTIITIPNDRLLSVIDKRTSLMEAFKIADDVLRDGVQGISEIITIPGLINVDFADVKAIMTNAGSALMGIGQAKGDDRAITAAKMAIASPLLDISIEGARGILFTVCGSSNLGMQEVNEAAKIITESADPNAKIIFGAIINDQLDDEIKITVIATGFGEDDSHVFSEMSSYQPTQRAKSIEESLETTKMTIKDLQKEPAKTKGASVEPSPRQTSDASARPIGKRLSSSAMPKTAEEDELEIPTFIRKKML